MIVEDLVRSVFDLLALLRQLEVIRESKVQINDRSDFVNDNATDKSVKLSQTVEERAGEGRATDSMCGFESTYSLSDSSDSNTP